MSGCLPQHSRRTVYELRFVLLDRHGPRRRAWPFVAAPRESAAGRHGLDLRISDSPRVHLVVRDAISLDLRHDLTHRRTIYLWIGERVEGKLTVEHSRRNRILNAELSFEPGFGLVVDQWLVGTWRKTDANALDLVGANIVLVQHLEKSAERPMIAITAGPAFEVDARLDDFPRVSQLLERRFQFHAVGGVGCQEIVGVVEYLIVGGDPSLRETCRRHCTARRMSCLKRLGHGAEVAHKARRLRCGDSPGTAQPGGVQTQ